jgi:hypothetical protein
MNTGRAPAAPAANQAWPNLFVSLAPDVAEAGDTGPVLSEAQFAALVRVLALANARRTSVVSVARGITTTSGRSAIGPCANR